MLDRVFGAVCCVLCADDEQSLGDDKVVDFSYTNVAPVLPNGWTLLGESAKFVTVRLWKLLLGV